ncbi:MAG: hypothetical protein A3A33_02240 [Candidatus Yanofskybacteria bacterium RIFCSPLOWO2_01_FULL_49_25]|uniref:Uncharacterized protein n=1 Tax=Candidatus Yanofskybacteria bacterium RIFCSPLOWO2_01_FULL_49_25 TaxID=1802701 RepID=A0A1F8GS93_9BACT|nr:MAG: hypothetical protein A3A33_02240 [Candidatus Yanofskybacteria bacterium RIFCSPLOWO2_01_FULL_49_25]
MKIAVFSDLFHPELNGVSDSALATARQLALRGHEIRFYVPRYTAKDYAIANLPPIERDWGRGITIRRLFSLPYPTGTGQGRAVIPSPFILRDVKAFRPDAIHAHLFMGVGWDALMAAKFLRIPLIGTNHTAISEFIRYSPIKAPWFSRFALRYVSWFYNRCRYVTTPSRSLIDEMIAWGFRKPHEVISNPIDTDLFKVPSAQERDAARKEFGLVGPTFVYAGGLFPQKNLDVLVRAMGHAVKQDPSITLMLPGHGSERSRLENIATEFSVLPRVRFLGTLEKPALARLFQAGDVFVIASTSETQNMSLIQAMACGLPAIGVRSRALPEYIPASAGLLVPPGDDRAFATAMIGLVHDDGKRLEMSQNAPACVERFSVSSIADRWELIYQEVIHKKV